MGALCRVDAGAHHHQNMSEMLEICFHVEILRFFFSILATDPNFKCSAGLHFGATPTKNHQEATFGPQAPGLHFL